jgi:hypothetical protein
MRNRRITGLNVLDVSLEGSDGVVIVILCRCILTFTIPIGVFVETDADAWLKDALPHPLEETER